MSNAMHVAKTGLNAQNSRMQVIANNLANVNTCLLYTSPSPRDDGVSRMPSSA